MQKADFMTSVVNGINEKFEDVKVAIVKKFPLIDEHIQKIENSNSVLRNQIELLRGRLSTTILKNIELNEDYENLQKKHEILENRYMKQEGLWEKAVQNTDIHELEVERVLLSSGAMSDKLFNGLKANQFGVVTARKLKIKPFDYSEWEVLYIDGGVVSSVEIKRYPQESMLDVMKTLIYVNNVEEIKAQSIYTEVGC